MKLLINGDDFNNKNIKDLIPLSCSNCLNTFYKTKRKIELATIRKSNTGINYISMCSRKCSHEFFRKKITLICKLCNSKFDRVESSIKKSKSGNSFCSKSCAVTFNNVNKTHGNVRSKLEIYIEDELTKLFPLLDIHFNRKDSINSELDIYIPSLKLAFELNGIFHYEPIFSEEKLKGIQNNDGRKFQACLEKNIELCIIDTSKQKYFKKDTSVEYLKIIGDIISSKI